MQRMRLWICFTMALHLFVGAALVSWAPFQSAGAAAVAVASYGDSTVSESLRVPLGSAPEEDIDSLASAISLALTDLPVEMSEVLSASPRQQPAEGSQPAPCSAAMCKWASATSDGLLRPPKTLTSV